MKVEISDAFKPPNPSIDPFGPKMMMRTVTVEVDLLDQCATDAAKELLELARDISTRAVVK